MAFIRSCMLIASTFLLIFNTTAQTVYYPSQASSLLKSTAVDAADLFKKAMPGASFATQSYNNLPAAGIIFMYDSSVAGNQACRIESNGSSYIKFSAAEDNGLCFGFYQYMQQLGFHFYQPGSIWEIIPSLSSPYKNITTTVDCGLQYKTWYISGGHNRWAMDNNNSYNWDIYFGDNGHQWALYQRRNGMMGAYRFAGHRGDILTGNYLATIQSNPCYVACYNGSREANSQSVPDINNINATQLWSNAIEQKFTQFKTTIYGNTSLYTDYFHGFNFNYSHIGIEAPDGAKWGNSGDNAVCSNLGYPKESDQQFLLAGKTTEKINSLYPAAKTQCYAYSSHADIPSPSISISTNLDVQVIPTAFQNETSAKGLMSRWYGRHGNVSEYQYMNIPQWGGETPMFYLNDLKTTLQRVKEKNSQGIVWEASPAKFASLPFLMAANNKLLNNVEVDSTLKDFCNSLFGNASATVYKLLQLWSDDKSITTADFINDNKYKLPLYLQLLNTAVQQTQDAPEVQKQRISELKAYIHYMLLYYDWSFDQRSNDAKKEKAAALCIYLAKVNKLQLVNSYFLIADITSRYAVTDNFYTLYNVNNGSAYQNGNLSLITSAEIENNFTADINTTGNLIPQYKLVDAGTIKTQLKANNLNLLRKLSVKIGYTNGYNYPNRSEFFIDAPAAGNFSVVYTPKFDMAGQGQINFTVDAVDKGTEVIKDFTISNGSAAGNFTVSLPAAGRYMLTVVSKAKSGVDLVITTNGNYFYKNAAFIGNKTENYRDDLASLPGYFYVPQGIDKVYFSVNNGNPGGAGFATANDINKAFAFKDNNGNNINAESVSSDLALFYIPVNAGTNGAFFKVSKMEQYRLCFSNISNILWYAESDYCTGTAFTVSLINSKGECHTRLTTTNNKDGLQWEVVDGSRTLNFNNVSVVDLPAYISPNALITLKDGTTCSSSRRLADDPKYLSEKTSCASGAAIATSSELTMSPNPSAGIFYCSSNRSFVKADEIIVSSSQGSQVYSVKNSNQVNISQLAPGIYFYRCLVNGKEFKGKLVKL
ncbi:MAG: T9SS type A sorting domain-containing protein [Ferruginibacter sp.]